MRDLNVNHIYRVYTLLLLKTEPRHGYEIIDRIEKMTGEEPSTSHIYPFLSELEEKGYLESEEEVEEDESGSEDESEEDFVCDVCDESFESKRDLASHKIENH